MKLFAVKMNKSAGVLVNPSSKLSSPVKNYLAGEYAVFNTEQMNMIPNEFYEKICEVKKKATRKKKED